MHQDFFTNLPTEIMLDIVLRLPIRSIMSWKCVCKSWRDLIKTREFFESHFSISVPCLALFQGRISRPYKIIEFVDTHISHGNMVLNFRFPRQTMLHSSANGLLFLSNNNANANVRDLFICNPMTREYIKLPPPLGVSVVNQYSNVFGFGVSKLNDECKVVRLFYHDKHLTTPRKCEVYSLRRGLWRSVATAGDQLWYAQHMSFPISLNGNLHWLVDPYLEDQYHQRILCFDLETECFSTFSIPHHIYGSLSVLGDSLCFCDNVFRDHIVVIWLMNKYGDDKSWRKEFVIEAQAPYGLGGLLVPIKVYKDGDILFVINNCSSKLQSYSTKTKTIRKIVEAGLFFKVGTIPSVYTPSFVPLKTFTLENNVISF